MIFNIFLSNRWVIVEFRSIIVITYIFDYFLGEQDLLFQIYFPDEHDILDDTDMYPAINDILFKENNILRSK